MEHRKWKMVVVGLILAANGVHGATIVGTVYDGLTLEAQANSILTIDTSPMQTKLSKDGTYSFMVGNGTYTLDAEYWENGIVTQHAQRTMVISQEGEYTIDIILLPEIGSVPEDPLPGEENEPGILNQLAGNVPWWGLLAVLLGVVGYAIWNVIRATQKHPRDYREEENEKKETIETKKEKDSDENSKKENEGERILDQYAMETIHHLKRGGNRLTQKELRSMMKIGEAKVSLVVSELEEENIIKKIKRGRGNILILTEKGIAYAEKNGPVKKINNE